MSPRLGVYRTAAARVIARILLPTLALSLSACTQQPLIPYSVETPPLILIPASHAGVVDDRGRFREILCGLNKHHGNDLPNNRPCDETLHRLANEPPPTHRPVHWGRPRLKLKFAVVPGLLAECFKSFVSPLPYARTHIEKLGYETTTINVGGRSGTTHNASQIRDAVMAMQLAQDQQLVLVGYSKGAPDILEALVHHPEIVGRVAAVVTIAGAVAGSPLADGSSEFQKSLIGLPEDSTCPPGDSLAIDSLSRAVRLNWLAENRLPKSVEYFSLVAFADRKRISTILRSGYDKLSKIDSRNDGQVIFTDAIVPGGRLLGFVQVDHWGVAIPLSRDFPLLAKTLINRNEFPREIMLEAIARHVEERLLARED